MADETARVVRLQDVGSALAANIAWLATLGMAILALALIPTERLVDFRDYGPRAIAVLTNMGQRILVAPALTFVTWLAPIPVAMALPLAATEWPAKLAAFALFYVAAIAFVAIPGEPARFARNLRDEPAMGYMAHDTVLILAAAAAANPAAVATLGGPATAIAFGEARCFASNSRRAAVLAASAAVSAVVVLPTVDVFIDADDGFFLEGYTTDSIVSTLWSVGLMVCWVRTYHLVCRAAAATLREAPVTSVLFAVVGTALVVVYVSAAYAVFVAYGLYRGLRRLE